MADDDKRSQHLLSDDAIPRVQVPKTSSAGMREFRLPSVVGKKPRESLTTGSTPTVPESAAMAEKPAGKAGKTAGKSRRRRPSTGRFRDRTLNWFKTGEALEGEEHVDGDYEPLAERNWLLIGGAVAGVIALALIALWVIS